MELILQEATQDVIVIRLQYWISLEITSFKT